MEELFPGDGLSRGEKVLQQIKKIKAHPGQEKGRQHSAGKGWDALVKRSV